MFHSAFVDRARPLPSASTFQHLFAGLLMLADWLGSSDEPERFPFAQPSDPPRADFVRARAPEVLEAIGFVPPCPPRPLPPFDGQFRFSPRAAQRAIDALPLPDQRGSVGLLESETGSGKTEAALRFDLLFRRDGEAVRHRIARDYYRRQYNLQKLEESAA